MIWNRLLPWENLGHIDHSACFLRTQSQRTYIVGEVLTTPPSQLMHDVVYFFATFLLRTREVGERIATLSPMRKQLGMNPRLKLSCWFRPILEYLRHSTGATIIALNLRPTGENKRKQEQLQATLQAGPAKALEIYKYRGAPLSCSSSDLNF